MPRLLPSSAMQYGLIAALFALLLWGVLVPGGNARAGALAAPAGTPVTMGTPPVRPAPSAPVAALPPAPSGSASARTPVATPSAGGTVVAAAPALPRLPGTRVLTATPTRTPIGRVSAVIVRDLSPLAFTLNGHDQVAQTTLAVAVGDTAPAVRQPGWTLSLSVDQFHVAGDTARALPEDAVTLLGVTVACAADTECTMPENTLTYPLVMPAGMAVPIYAAAPGSGSGQFTVIPTLAVRVPGNAYAGSYITAITVNIAH